MRCVTRSEERPPEDPGDTRRREDPVARDAEEKQEAEDEARPSTGSRLGQSVVDPEVGERWPGELPWPVRSPRSGRQPTQPFTTKANRHLQCRQKKNIREESTGRIIYNSSL